VVNELPLVSLVVRTRDREAFLRRALDSIAGQEYPNIELVLVNDGGRPVDVLLSGMEGRVKVVYVEHPEARGRPAALNAGLHAATGELIGYLDDDDVLYPDHVGTLVAALRAQPSFPAAYTDAYAAAQEPDAASPTGYRTVDTELVHSWDFELPEFMLDNHIPNLCVVHSRAVALEIGGYDETLAVLEDWDFFIRLALRHGPFLHVPVTTGEYSVRADQTNTIGLMPEIYIDRRRYVWSKHAGVELRVPVSFLQNERLTLNGLREKLAGRENELLWWEDRWSRFENRGVMRIYRAVQAAAVRLGLIDQKTIDHEALQKKSARRAD
jgi:glycosyltransferase involved in cell wall biosynthesis